MVGIVKKIDGDGFGIMACANGSKILFIRADITNRNRLEPGETKHAPKEIGTLASRTRRVSNGLVSEVGGRAIA